MRLVPASRGFRWRQHLLLLLFFLLLLFLFWVEGGPARLRWMFLYRYVCVTSPTTWLFASDSHLIDSPSRLCTETPFVCIRNVNGEMVDDSWLVPGSSADIFMLPENKREREKKSFTDWGRLAYIFFIAQHSNKHCKLISPDDDDLQVKFPSSCSHPGRTGGRLFDPDA